MRQKLFTLFRFLSVPAATAAILIYLLSQPVAHRMSFEALAQGTPNCQFTYSFTAAGVSPVVQNGPTTSGGPQGCVAFRMVYWVQAGSGTVSALSLQLQGASLSTGSYTALTPAVGGGSGSGSTTNPVTSSPNGQNVTCCDYWPFLEIKINTLTVNTGAPILIVKVLGYAGTSAGAGTGGGSGGGTIADTTNTLKGDGSGNAVAVTGTGTNCVLVNGGSQACPAAGVKSIVGTATFNPSAGSIGSLVTTGIVSGVTYTTTGTYAVSVTGSPTGYLVSGITAQNSSSGEITILELSSAGLGTTGFTLLAVGVNPNQLADPNFVSVLVYN